MTLYDRLVKRIEFLKQQIAASGRLDGWTLAGHKKELIDLEEKIKK
jgi:hypothetical protein